MSSEVKTGAPIFQFESSTHDAAVEEWRRAVVDAATIAAKTDVTAAEAFKDRGRDNACVFARSERTKTLWADSIRTIDVGRNTSTNTLSGTAMAIVHLTLQPSFDWYRLILPALYAVDLLPMGNHPADPSRTGFSTTWTATEWQPNPHPVEVALISAHVPVFTRSASIGNAGSYPLAHWPEAILRSPSFRRELPSPAVVLQLCEECICGHPSALPRCVWRGAVANLSLSA